MYGIHGARGIYIRKLCDKAVYILCFLGTHSLFTRTPTAATKGEMFSMLILKRRSFRRNNQHICFKFNEAERRILFPSCVFF